MSLRSLLVFITSFVWSLSSAYSSDKTEVCNKALFPYSAEKIAEQLKDIPSLRELILRMMDDPEIPRSIKVIIKRTLQYKKIDVRQITDELRTKWNFFEEEFGAFANASRPPYIKFSLKGATPNANAAMGSRVKAKFNQKYGVAVSDRPIHSTQNDLVVLIHELAHIRFEIFLRKNLKKILPNLPKSLAYIDKKNRIWLNADLHSLMHERYAFQVEYLAAKSTHDKYYDDWFLKFGNNPTDIEPSTMPDKISDFVVDKYKISDPRVKGLAKVPLYKLLLGAGKEALLNFLLDKSLPNLSLFIPEKAKSLTYAIGRRVLYRLGEAEAPPSMELIISQFNELEKIENAPQVITKVFDTLLESAENTEPALIEVIAVMSNPQIREGLNRNGWTLPTKENFTIQEVIKGHPIMGAILDHTLPKEFDLNKRIISTIVVRYLQLDIMNSDLVIDTLKQGHRLTGDYEHFIRFSKNWTHSFSLPIKELKKFNVEEKSLYFSVVTSVMGKPKSELLNLWESLGLKEEFQKAFPEPEKFWDTEETFIEVFARLAPKDWILPYTYAAKTL